MTVEKGPAPRPQRAPEWAGEGDARRDVAGLSDRGVAIMALDAVLRVSVALGRMLGEFTKFRRVADDERVILLRELPELTDRVIALEKSSAGSMRPEAKSWHDWDESFTQAAAVLSQRVKDPHDRLDSNRAREIAREVVSGAKTVEDAQAFRTLKSRGWAIAAEIGKIVAAAAVGAIGAWLGFKGLSP